MKRFFSYLLQGLLYVVPIAVTIYVIIKIVHIADSLSRGVPFFGDIPGVGLVIILGLIAVIGYAAPKFVSPQLAHWFDNLISSTPLVKLIYTSVRDLMNSFVGEKRKFDSPVLVCLDKEGVNHRFGFITQEDLSQLGITGFVAVYCPYSLSFMGDLVVVPRENVKPLDINSAELMKMVVSGGVSGKEEQLFEDSKN